MQINEEKQQQVIRNKMAIRILLMNRHRDEAQLKVRSKLMMGRINGCIFWTVVFIIFFSKQKYAHYGCCKIVSLQNCLVTELSHCRIFSLQNFSSIFSYAYKEMILRDLFNNWCHSLLPHSISKYSFPLILHAYYFILHTKTNIKRLNQCLLQNKRTSIKSPLKEMKKRDSSFSLRNDAIYLCQNLIQSFSLNYYWCDF